MEFIPASSYSLTFFSVLIVGIIGGILFGAFKLKGPRYTLKLGTFLFWWIGGMSSLVNSGKLAEFLIPAVPLFLISIILCGIGVGLSGWGKDFSQLPIWSLVAFQGFRLPLEIVLHLWFLTGTVPETMTWSGQNWDIITGIIALGALIPRFRSVKFYWTVNILGLLLLLNVIRVVIMSSPFPFSWNLETPLQLALYMPYAMIGFICVWAAFAGHVVLTRALIKKA